MKTQNIVSAFRNAATPAARLAAWQSHHPIRHLKDLRERMAANYSPPATLAEARREAIANMGPELSSPEADHPLLWLSGENDPEVLAAYAGRDHGLDHRGWYSDPYQDETLETYAVRLARFPRLLFYAVRDSMSGDLRVRLDEWEEIDFSEAVSDYQADDAIRDAARELVRAYDYTTECEAEESREFYEKEDRKAQIEENRDTLKTLRASIVSLARECRELCASPTAQRYPAAAEAIRERLAAMLRERASLISTNRKLADA